MSVDPIRALSEGRSDLFSFDPEKLVIIEDPKHPLYDERAFGPVDEALVLNIMANGVLQPIIFRTEEMNGKNVAVVIAGRQRVKAAREANKRLAAKGEPLRMVPAVRRKSNDHDTIGFMVSENELRKNDDMLIKASKARRMMEEYSYSEEKCALMFGVSVATLRRYMAIDEATPEVRSAFVAGELPAGAAVELAKLQPADQREAVANMKANGKAGKKKHQGAEKAARETAKAKGAPPVKEREHLRSIKQVRALVDYLNEEVPCARDRPQHETVLVVLRWVMGGGPEELTGLLEGMQMELPKGATDK